MRRARRPVHRRLIGALALTASAACLAASAPYAGAGPATPSFAGTPIVVDGLTLPARVVGEDVALAVGGSFAPRFWAGVNLGATVPGRLPGEVAATRRDYDRWLADMGRFGVHALRVYTILRPAFYEALAAYNRAHPQSPIYVIHGVWIPEERFIQTQDAYDPEVVDGFRRELADAVAVVHGDATIPPVRGHASGTYRTSIAPWLLGWSIGVEWDPGATAASDAKNQDQPYTPGRYVEAVPGSTAMERWLAGMLDHVATLEAARGWSRPLTFTNWLTADPLRHPEEPLATEDMVSVDATHVRATGQWPGGFFASYHAYPYYPDFLGLQPSYLGARRASTGRADPYAGYLRELRAHHRGQAVMITEFGVPSSLGVAHRGPLGRDQGDHSEREAMRLDADMLRVIEEEGYSGGIVFQWIDEWFKHTWNTVDLEQPAERRQLWRNDLTNEEHFGVVAADPGAAPAVVLDGDDREWAGHSQVILESPGPVAEVRAAHDPGYLYLRLRTRTPAAWTRAPITVGLDVQPGGNRGVPGRRGVHRAAEVAVTVGPGRRANIRQAAWTDALPFLYGRFVPTRRADLRPGSGVWVAPRQILNRPRLVPSTGQTLPVQVTDLGHLRWGTSDPRRPGFDERNLVMASGRVVEIRIPWALLNFADPSSRLVAVPHADGTITTRAVRRVGISVAGPGRAVAMTRGYAWDPWGTVRWHERLKDGWQVLASAFAATSRR